MTRTKFALILAGAVALAPTVSAQPAGPPAGPRPMGPPPGGMVRNDAMRRENMPDGPGQEAAPPPGIDPASMLLAHTGEFKLTDAQVTKLAAIARRSAERRKTMRATVDSLRSANRAGSQQPNAEPPQGPPPAARAQMDNMREAVHVDLRDAIAVLTPEQQALGWEMMARGGEPGGGMRRGRQGGRGAGAPMQQGPGMNGPHGGPQDQPRPARRPPGDSLDR